MTPNDTIFHEESIMNVFTDLVGKVVESVSESKNADEGFLITFTDGTTLEVGYSTYEGGVELNGEEQDTRFDPQGLPWAHKYEDGD
jgi:hypothetical protein